MTEKNKNNLIALIYRRRNVWSK